MSGQTTVTSPATISAGRSNRSPPQRMAMVVKVSVPSPVISTQSNPLKQGSPPPSMVQSWPFSAKGSWLSDSAVPLLAAMSNQRRQLSGSSSAVSSDGSVFAASSVGIPQAFSTSSRHASSRASSRFIPRFSSIFLIWRPAAFQIPPPHPSAAVGSANAGDKCLRIGHTSRNPKPFVPARYAPAYSNSPRSSRDGAA